MDSLDRCMAALLDEQSAKNSLIPADAQQVENAFQSKLAKLTTETENDGPLPSLSIPSSSTAEPAAISVRDGIDKSRLAHAEVRRLRDKLHVKFVAKQPCGVCGQSVGSASSPIRAGPGARMQGQR
jgi:hypothetical protein